MIQQIDVILSQLFKKNIILKNKTKQNYLFEESKNNNQALAPQYRQVTPLYIIIFCLKIMTLSPCVSHALIPGAL